MMKKLHKSFSKTLLAIFALGFITILGAFADEPLPIFDPAVQEVELITFEVKFFGNKTTFVNDVEVDTLQRLVAYFETELSRNNLAIPIELVSSPLFCNELGGETVSL